MKSPDCDCTLCAFSKRYPQLKALRCTDLSRGRVVPPEPEWSPYARRSA